MKNKFRYSIILIAILGVMQVTCKKPDTGITVNINADVAKYTQLVEFTDAATGLAPTASISIKITGPDADKVYEISGVKSFIPVDGIISFMFDPTTVVSTTNPLTYNIVASAPGYLSVCRKVTITSVDSQAYIQIPMVNLSGLPDGASYKPFSVTISNGVLPSAVSISTPIVSGKKVDSCKLTLPAGMKFYDSLGNQIQNGSVSGRIVHFENRNSDALSYFPGGSPLAENFIDRNGNSTPSLFYTMGYADITMNVGSTPITKFDPNPALQPTLTMEINDTAINPETGVAMKDGDTLGVFSYKLETNQWKYDATDTVKKNGTKLYMSHKLAHLTTYNFDFFSASNCTGKTVTITSTNNAALGSFNETYTFTFIPNNWNIKSYYQPHVVYNGKLPFSLNFARSPGVTGTLKVTTAGGLSGFASNVNLCNAPATVTLNVPNDYVNVYVKITGTCKYDKAKVVSPSFYVYYKLKSSPVNSYKLLGFVNKGLFTTSALKKNQTYDFKAVFGGKTYYTTQTVLNTINTATVDMSSTSFCSQ